MCRDADADEISVWNGALQSPSSFDAGTLQPLSFDGPDPVGFQSILLTARSAVDQLDPLLAQMTSDFAGVVSLRIPGDGRIVKFQDPVQSRSGFLHVDATGHARTLVDLPFVSGIDPFATVVAVSAWEQRAAVVTDADVAGSADVYLLRLDGQSFANGQPWFVVSSAITLPDVEPASLTFTADSLYFTHLDSTLYRSPTDGLSGATLIALPPSGSNAPVVIGEEMQVSRDGKVIAVLAGETEDLWDIYVGDEGGTFANLTQSPAAYQPVGHLPEPTGPFLALNEDGSRITYGREDLEVEYFSRLTDGSNAPIHLTEDAFFVESIGDTTGVGDFAGQIVMVSGENPDTRDLYQVTLSGTQVLQVSNLTRTSGDTAIPWDKGAKINPLCAARGGDELSMVVVDDRTVEVGIPAFDWWTADSGGALLQAGALAKMPVFMARKTAGGTTRLAILEDTAGTRLVRLPAAATQSAQTLVAAPAGVFLSALSINSPGTQAALIASAAPGISLFAIVDTLSGQAIVPLPLIADYGTQTLWNAADVLQFGFGFAGRRLALVLGPQGLRPLPGILGAPSFF